MGTSIELIESNLKALAIYHANNDCMTVKECAKYLKKCDKTILNHIEKGKIKAIQLERDYSIPKIQFMEKIINEWKQ